MLLNTDQFLWQPGRDDRRGTFTVEASTLRWQQVPQEFVLQSARTGRKVHMEAERVDRDAEGEVIAWIYKPKGPLRFRVTVFND
jgi:hypothetical protein